MNKNIFVLFLVIIFLSMTPAAHAENINQAKQPNKQLMNEAKLAVNAMQLAHSLKLNLKAKVEKRGIKWSEFLKRLSVTMGQDSANGISDECAMAILGDDGAGVVEECPADYSESDNSGDGESDNSGDGESPADGDDDDDDDDE
jgi:hypothetical protein